MIYLNRKIKIVFIGSVDFSRSVLEKLLRLKVEIVGVVCKKTGEGQADFCDLSAICVKYGLNYFKTDKINSPETVRFVKKLAPDYIFCMGWSRLLKDNMLGAAKRGAVGFHPALLPRNRGRHPIIWSLALGLKKTGSTFFLMDSSADSGDIISQRQVPVLYSDDAGILYKRITRIALMQLGILVSELSKGRVNRIKQAQKNSSYWRRRGYYDGQIDWRMSSNSIYNLVRALAKPYGGAHFLRSGKEVKVWKVKERVCHNLDLEPGRVLKIYKDNSFLVKTGVNCVHVLEYAQRNMHFKVGECL